MRTWSAPIRRRVLRVVEWAAGGNPEAAHLLPLLKEHRRAPAKVGLGPTRKQRNQARQAGRREYMAGLRKDVLDRDGKLCVLCGTLATEVHHLVSGNGKRRTHEAMETLASLCFGCHREAHRGDRLALALLEGWCERRGYAEAQAALRKRIAKIEEATR